MSPLSHGTDRSPGTSEQPDGPLDRGAGALPQASSTPESWVLPGTVVVAFLVATGRWGSYVGLPEHQLFLTDLLVVATVGWTLYRQRARLRLERRQLWPIFPVLVLVGWALVRFLAGGDYGGGALRDLAPYAYLSLVLLAVVPASRASAQRAVDVLVIALVVHALLVTVVSLFPGWADDLPMLTPTVRLLQLRQDFDGAMLAVLAGSSLYRFIHASSIRARLGWSALIIWPAAVTFTLPNRAALLSLVLSLLIVIATVLPRLMRLTLRHPVTTIAVLVATVGALVVGVPRTAIYQRLSGDASFAYNSPGGTTEARLAAWSDVLTYMHESAGRATMGVGFGPDFLKASGAWVHYQAIGDTFGVVRQPHNFAVNTYARLGGVGLALLAIVLLLLAWAAMSLLRRRDALAPIDVSALLIVATLSLTGSIGVILESPFGAIPFAWAAGRLLLSSSERSAG